MTGAASGGGVITGKTRQLGERCTLVRSRSVLSIFSASSSRPPAIAARISPNRAVSAATAAATAGFGASAGGGAGFGVASAGGGSTAFGIGARFAALGNGEASGAAGGAEVATGFTAAEAGAAGAGRGGRGVVAAGGAGAATGGGGGGVTTGGGVAITGEGAGEACAPVLAQARELSALECHRTASRDQPPGCVRNNMHPQRQALRRDGPPALRGAPSGWVADEWRSRERWRRLQATSTPRITNHGMPSAPGGKTFIAAARWVQAR